MTVTSDPWPSTALAIAPRSPTVVTTRRFLACAAAAQAKNLRVVTTVGDLGAIAKAVLGQGSDVTVIAKPTQDPHFVDAKPSLIVDLNRSDALCLMGLDYEIGWLPVLLS